jgi:predicted RNase H-like HicB family nuclease
VTLADAPHAAETETLTVVYEPAEEGGWTTTIPGTGAIGQGATREAARANAIAALFALTHAPTRIERVAHWLQARVDFLRQL